MEKYLQFPDKSIEDVSDSNIKIMTRKGVKKTTNELKKRNIQKKKNISSTSSLIKIKNKKEREKEKETNSYSSGNRSLLIKEEIEDEKIKKMPKIQKQKEKRYIVDNMEDILSKITSEKLKLFIQEILLYTIVFMVCVYHWIFLFISRDKFELNFCFINGQFDACSKDQICKDYSSKMNLILFNNTLSIKAHTAFISYDYFIEENKLINEYYKPFFAEYSDNLSRDKAMGKMQIMHNSKERINYVIALSYKEKWNLFYRNFNLCEAKNYFVVFVVMISFGGILGSLVFGFLSDIFGRRSVIRSTLFIITLTTFLFAGFSYAMDQYCLNKFKEFDNNPEFSKTNQLYHDPNFKEIIKQIYIQEKVRNYFKKMFFVFCIIIFFLSAGLWPLLKSCMALLIENAKGELDVLIGFRRYNLAFGGLPGFFTSLIFANLNNFTLTFAILGIINLIIFIFSLTFFEESIRYYYEYCEWPQLTETVLKIYKVDIDQFKTLNVKELKKFRREENIKNFNSSVQNNNYFLHNDSTLVFQNSYYNLFKEKNIALKRNIKRDTDFIINLSNVRANPVSIIICLFSNRTFNNSKMLILVILILLYVTMNLIQKEFLEKPFFTMKSFFINFQNNILINTDLFYLIIANLLSNLSFYGLYRINCFKTVIFVSLIYNTIALFAYHILSNLSKETPIYFNQYNPKMLDELNKENLSLYCLIFLYTIYFLLNGVNFYVYLLILKISKTIYRCTYFSIHSIALIVAFILTECIHLIMDHYFLFLSILNIICLLTLPFLSEFKELLYVVNDLKIDIHRPSKNIYSRQKND